LEVHASKASAVVVQHVPAGDADWFMDWQRGTTAAAERFPGYRATDIYPADANQNEWVIVLHFVDEKSLQNWLTSPVRDEWVKKLKAKASTFRVETLSGGFGAWFVGKENQGKAGPAGWKMVLTVVLGLFPTVMLLSLIVGPYTAGLGFAVSMVIGNFMSVSILQWGVMPILTKVLAPWLNADSKQLGVSIGGAAIVLFATALLTVIFTLIAG
jgi:antibiotic biosynthesis monooxygenase (ABM) superfamily enzyme